MAANCAKELLWVFLLTTFCFSKLTIIVSQASSEKGVACEIREKSESQKQCCTTQWAERVDIFIHVKLDLLSGLQEASYWPKSGLRSNLIVSKFQSFLRKHALRPIGCLCTHYEPDHSKPDGYCPLQWLISSWVLVDYTGLLLHGCAVHIEDCGG